ncbi:MAG: hypothetical protein M1829_006108 [Trizodia sp. TS-e1964]|nr:MAG: hypothetical protein M1829_006108 [Trizodia sp. TS-e1964]
MESTIEELADTAILTTTVLVNNIHCSSCVSYVQHVLSLLHPAPLSVTTSVLTHKVTISHESQLSAKEICTALLNSGFEVHGAIVEDAGKREIESLGFSVKRDQTWLRNPEDSVGNRGSLTGDMQMPGPLAQKSKKHMKHCKACQLEEKQFLESQLQPPPLAKHRSSRWSRRSSAFVALRNMGRRPPSNCSEKIPLTGPDSPRYSNRESQQSSHSHSISNQGIFDHTIKIKHLNQTPGEHIIDIGSDEKLPANDDEEYEAVLSIGGMTCASCTGAVTEGVQEIPWVRSINVTLITNSASVIFDGPKTRIQEIVDRVEDLGFDCNADECYSVERPPPKQLLATPARPLPNVHQATLSIEGMTCAACTSGVTNGVQELPWVRTVDVNLLTNSAVVVYEGLQERIKEILEKIEDLGFDCFVQENVPFDDPSSHASSKDENAIWQTSEKTVTIKIDGIYCNHCPPRILDALRNSMQNRITINKPPTLQDRTISISYSPNPPEFTIRNILDTINAVDSSFRADLYHPPTIEERSRAMQLYERRRILARLILSTVVAVPTLLIGVVWMSLVSPSNKIRVYMEQPLWVGTATRADWALFILATPVYVLAADIFHRRAAKEIRSLWRRGSKVPILRRFYRFGSMNLLMSAGTTVAYFASFAILVIDALATPDPSNTRMSNSPTYFDSVVFLTMFILMGRFLEAYSKAKTGDAVATLGKLRPSHAIIAQFIEPQSALSEVSEMSDSSSALSKTVNIDHLEVGEIVKVLQGASPPADGLIVSGDSKFDESSLTGESRLINKGPGDEVFAGTVNHGKPILVKVTGVNGKSMLDQIVKVVREGQTKRAPVERIADLLTGYFVPAITLVAILTFAVWFALGQAGSLPHDWLDVETGGWAFWALQFAIAVFVVACPCGIGLAAPTALFVGSGLAAQHGILVKGGGEAFQEASALDVIVFDKTGTLTQGGNPSVTDHDILLPEKELKLAWAIICALEESSSHPIAKAIANLANSKERATIVKSDIEELAGYGLHGLFDIEDSHISRRYEALIGSEAFIASAGVAIDGYWSAKLTTWKNEGKSLALLALRDVTLPHDNQSYILAAQFAITDPLRPEAAFTVEKLKKSGISVWMLSGDNPTTARAVAAQVGIKADNVIAGVLPEGKAEKIKWLQENAHKRGSAKHIPGSKAIVAMVGDGINDSPALSIADVGIAIGSGSDVAISSAKFVLISSSLISILTLTQLSRKVFRRIKLNFCWALIYNIGMVPIAAGVVYPLNGHPRLGAVWASLAMAASSVSVICSSLLLRSRIPGIGFRVSEWEKSDST